MVCINNGAYDNYTEINHAVDRLNNLKPSLAILVIIIFVYKTF